MPVPGVALAQLLGGVDALALEGGRHADVGDEHLGRGGGGAGDQLVVVARGPDDLEVGLDREQRAHALADDDVVVGEEDGDPVGVGVGTIGTIQSHARHVRQVARATAPGVLASRREPCCHQAFEPARRSTPASDGDAGMTRRGGTRRDTSCRSGRVRDLGSVAAISR